MDILYAEFAVGNCRAQSEDKSARSSREKEEEEAEEEEEEAERENEEMTRTDTVSGVVLRPLAKTEREMPLLTGDGGKVSKEAPKSLSCSLQGFCRVLRVLGLLGLYTAMGVLFFSLPFVVNQTVRLRERFYSPRKIVQENRAGKNFEVEELFPTFAKLNKFELNVTQPGLKAFASIVAECDRIQDTRRSAIKYLSEVLQLKENTDEFGRKSQLVQPVDLIRKLIADGRIKNRTRPLYAVNFGARDGKGEGGNTDPTYPLFAELGFRGVAVEANPIFLEQLRKNMEGLSIGDGCGGGGGGGHVRTAECARVQVIQSFITPENAVALIARAMMPAVDVFKIDIDSFDCDVIPRVLHAYSPALLIVEYNVYFPPPIKMKLEAPHGYNSDKRSNIYECSIQFLNDDVMRPYGYVLLQLDWQNVMYVRKELAAELGMPDGVDVQAAYYAGYTSQPNRTTFIPWGKPLEHLLHAPTHAQRMLEALTWASHSTHKQPEGVLIGCGSKLTQLRFVSRLAMPEFEWSSHLAKRPPIFVSPLFQTKFGSLQSLQEWQAPSLADTQQARQQQQPHGAVPAGSA